MKEIVNTNICCPKCKSKNLALVELWENHSIAWNQVNGSFDRQDGALEMGYPTSMLGICDKCKNCWTIPDAMQITDIII